MKREVYADDFQKEDGTKTSRVREEIKGLQRLKLLHLRSLHVFDTQFTAMQSTKILASKMHGGSLWLDKEYPIHVEDISWLTGLSIGGNTVSSAFQTGAKRVKKRSEDNIYAKYGTKQGGRGAKLDIINKVNIRFPYYLVVGKTMCHFTKNECTLDAILVVEHYFQGEVLNWSTFVLNELFEDYEYVYKKATNFMFGYILMSLAMWKWKPLKERELATIVEGQPLELCYEPWRASGDPNTKEINEIAFKDWCEQMLVTIRSTKRIPKTLLEEFSEEIYFRASHAHTYLRSWCVHLETFNMRPQRFVLMIEALHKELGSWPRVAWKITDGKCNYLFGALKQ